MSSRCPGQDFRKLSISIHPCPECQKPVEFFSDELRARCPTCKTMVQKDSSPSCIQWCKAARDCIGADLYDALIGQMSEEQRREMDEAVR